eukprot:scaffold14901_cov102-Isochrysis_galbana.AAC.1
MRSSGRRGKRNVDGPAGNVTQLILGYKARSQSNFRQNARSQSNFARSQTNFISNCTVLICLDGP